MVITFISMVIPSEPFSRNCHVVIKIDLVPLLEYEEYQSPRSKENPHWFFILSLASLGGIRSTKRLLLGWVSLYK